MHHEMDLRGDEAGADDETNNNRKSKKNEQDTVMQKLIGHPELQALDIGKHVQITPNVADQA